MPVQYYAPILPLFPILPSVTPPATAEPSGSGCQRTAKPSAPPPAADHISGAYRMCFYFWYYAYCRLAAQQVISSCLNDDSPDAESTRRDKDAERARRAASLGVVQRQRGAHEAQAAESQASDGRTLAMRDTQARRDSSQTTAAPALPKGGNRG